MLIYNTTFHTEISCYDEFITWLRQEYIPGAMSHKGVSEPRMARIYGEDDSNGRSVSLQFNTPDLHTLSEWYNGCGSRWVELLQKKFGNKVAGFATIMEQLEI